MFVLIRNLLRVNPFKFIWFNFFSNKVIREKRCFIIPCYGTYFQLEKNSKIYLKGNLYLNYYPIYKRGNRMTLLKVGNNAELHVNGRVLIGYGNTISVDKDAKLEIGKFYSGIDSNIVCHFDIKIGQNVMLGRDVCVFDSDYHPLYDETGSIINPDKSVIIEDNAWIGARSMVIKGAHVKAGAVVSANTMVLGDIEGGRVFINKREGRSLGGIVTWER